MINNADDDRVFGDQAGGGGGGGDGFPSGGNGNGINKKNVLENENKVLAGRYSYCFWNMRNYLVVNRTSKEK